MTGTDLFPRRLRVTDSAVLDEIAYNPTTKKLRVMFISGTIWVYEDVYPREFGEIAASYSTGKTFNRLVRNAKRGYRTFPVDHPDRTQDPQPNGAGPIVVDRRFAALPEF
jgi:hypothetical protein